MKCFLLVLFILFFSFSLLASTLVINDDSISFKSEKVSFNYNLYGIMGEIKSGDVSFSFGDGNKSGLLYYVSDPYKAAVNPPKVSEFSKSTDINLTILKIKNLSLLSFGGKREGMGIFIESEYLDFFSLYKEKTPDHRVMRESTTSQDLDTFYLGFKARWKYFGIENIYSLTSSLFLSSYLKLCVSQWGFRVEASSGTIQSFLSTSPFRHSLLLSLDRDNFYVEFKIKMGGKPIYLHEYRALELEYKAKLIVEETTLSSSMVRSFIKGKEKTKIKIELINNEATLSYEPSKGFGAILRIGEATIHGEIGELSISFSIAGNNATLTLSSKKLTSFKIEINI